jgi:hypothetical protein
MADDHAYQAISAYDDTLIRTPNIDRLAAEGVRFDAAFVGNSICSPSRATLLTGKFSHANGLRNNVNVFDGSQQTLQALMQEAGYETAIIGKWHLKSEPTGFDHWEVLPDQGKYYNPDFVSSGGTLRYEGYVTDITTDVAIDWIDSRDDESPFLLFYHHKAPHREWWPAIEHIAEFHDRPIPEPASLFDDYASRGRAAAEAEMRIADHMGLTNDNKITPDNAAALGHEPFMDWYDNAWRRQHDAYMNEAQRAAIDAVYGPINDEFVAENPQGDALTRWKYQRYMQDYLLLSDAEKKTLADIGYQLGRKALEAVANTAKPDTILGWYRKLVARKFDGSEARRSHGRPRIDCEIEALVLRMAKENVDWGYDRIVGALANLGYTVSDQTVGNILRRNGIPPAPERKQTTTWKAFIRVHLDVLAGTDFFTVEVLTLRGLVTTCCSVRHEVARVFIREV